MTLATRLKGKIVMLNLEWCSAWIVKKNEQWERGEIYRDGSLMVMIFIMRGS